MAIANADGSIVLTTKVDTKGITSGTKTIQSKLQGLQSTIGKVGAAIGLAFSVSKLIQFSNAAGQLATQTEASVQRLIDIYGTASDTVGDFIDQNARALGMSKSAAASFSAIYGNLFSVWADQATNAELTNQYLQMTAVVASKTGRTVEDVQERIRSGLLGNTEAIEDLGVFVNVKTIEMTDAFKRMADGKSWQQLDAYTQQQIRTMAILEQSTAKYGNQLAETSATTRNQFKAAYEDFQNSWGNIVNTVLLPVLKVLTRVMEIATIGLNAISGVSGKLLGDTESVENNSNKTAQNIQYQTDEQKKFNKEMKKGIAGFDELNILSEQTAENTSSTVGAGIGDIGGTTSVGSLDGSGYVTEISETLMAIMGVVGLSLIAVGLILLFTGNIAWGIGFVIAGVATVGVVMAAASAFDYNGVIQMLTTIMGIAGGALLAIGIMLLWFGGIVGKGVAIGMIVAGGLLLVGAVAAQAALKPNDIKEWLSLILGIAGGALLALGIILCVFGSIPLGVGMIIAGAVSLVSAFALKSNAVVEAIKGSLGAVMILVGGFLLVIGIILTCTGNFGVGIPLIAVGAVSLGASVALNWGSIGTKIKELFTKYGAIIAAAGVALIVIGILLCSANIILGIGLIVMGVGALVATVVLNWDAIVNKVTEIFQKFGGIIAAAGVALIVLGIILCCTGVGIGLGIGLILAGAAGVAGAVAFNWNAIVDKVKAIWKSIKDYWNNNIAKYFTAAWWGNLGKTAINGLLRWIVNGLNKLIEKLNQFGFNLPDVLGGGRVGFNLRYLNIPQLAKGAVIPANQPFLAMLGDQKQGTNIEAPLETIKQGVAEVLASMSLSNGNNQPMEIYLVMNSDVIGRASVDYHNGVVKRTGVTPLLGVK